jgi:hypothetical protein
MDKSLPPTPTLPPRPPTKRLQSNNPFNNSTYNDLGHNHFVIGDEEIERSTFGNGGKKAIMNGNVDDVEAWDDWGGKITPTSPTSSRSTGTTSTKMSMDEDPFR